MSLNITNLVRFATAKDAKALRSVMNPVIVRNPLPLPRLQEQAKGWLNQVDRDLDGVEQDIARNAAKIRNAASVPNWYRPAQARLAAERKDLLEERASVATVMTVVEQMIYDRRPAVIIKAPQPVVSSTVTPVETVVVIQPLPVMKPKAKVKKVAVARDEARFTSFESLKDALYGEINPENEALLQGMLAQ
jgi:hypothetical protein